MGASPEAMGFKLNRIKDKEFLTRFERRD